jgi:hypothetical protein
VQHVTPSKRPRQWAAINRGGFVQCRTYNQARSWLANSNPNTGDIYRLHTPPRTFRHRRAVPQRVRVQGSTEACAELNQLLLDVASSADLLLSELLNSRCRASRVSVARRALCLLITSRFWFRLITKRSTSEPRIVAMRSAQEMAEAKAISTTPYMKRDLARWKPPSVEILAQLLGVDHAAIVRMRQKGKADADS